MKVRSDFVTNSSSSSYIIAIKADALALLEEETAKLSPLMRGLVAAGMESLKPLLSHRDISRSYSIQDDFAQVCVCNLADLERHIRDNGLFYDDIDVDTSFEEAAKESGEFAEFYRLAKKALSENHVIHFLSLDYNDKITENALRALLHANIAINLGENHP